MSQFKVLVPLDGSKLAEAPLSHLSSLRALGEVELTLLSVVEENPDAADLRSNEAIDREQNLLRSYINDVANDISSHLDLPAEARIAYGKPAECILDIAKEMQPDLIVISTHGRSGPARWRLGSVADKVIRGAPCNLMVMGKEASQTATWFAEIVEPFQTVLVPLDGSDLAEQAIPVAQLFADRYNSVLHFVRVVTIPVYGDISDVGVPSLIDVMQDNATKYLDVIASRDGMPEKTVQKVVVGSPASALLDYIEDNHIGLVVMTTHGRSGISRTALGSVTDRLLSSNAPVLVVKAAEPGK